MDFPGNLKNIRKKRGLSQQKLAEKLDIHQSAIANYEAGIRKPRVSELERIAKALKVGIIKLVK